MAAGEITGLIGPSRSGKTTLAMVAGGIRPPTTGGRVVDGQPTRRWGWDAPPAERRRVQLVLQQPHRALDPCHTLAQSLLRPARLHGVPDQTALGWAARCRVDDALLDRRPGQVSGGQLQRLALARALTLDPDYLLVDEVTTAQDTITTAIIVHLLREQAGRGAGVLLITHDQHLLEDLAKLIHRTA